MNKEKSNIALKALIILILFLSPYINQKILGGIVALSAGYISITLFSNRRNLLAFAYLGTAISFFPMLLSDMRLEYLLFIRIIVESMVIVDIFSWSILNNLVILLYARGKYDKAEKLGKQSIRLAGQIFGKYNKNYASSLNTLAEIYHASGKYRQAEYTYKDAVSLKKKVLGQDHIDFANTLNNFALLQLIQNKFAKAESLFRQSLEIRNKRLKGNHPDIAESLNNVALALYSQARYEEAETLINQAINIWKDAKGNNELTIAQCLDYLDKIHKFQGKQEKIDKDIVQLLEKARIEKIEELEPVLVGAGITAGGNELEMKAYPLIKYSEVNIPLIPPSEEESTILDSLFIDNTEAFLWPRPKRPKTTSAKNCPRSLRKLGWSSVTEL